LFGTGFGKETQIYDMAASDRAGSGYGVANSAYDEYVRDTQEETMLPFNMSCARQLAKREDAILKHLLMLQSIHQESPMHSLMQSLSLLQRQNLCIV